MANQKNPIRHSSNASMSAALRAMRIRTFVLVLLEIAVLATAVLFYFYDFPKGFQEQVKPVYWIIFAAAVPHADHGRPTIAVIHGRPPSNPRRTQ